MAGGSLSASPGVGLEDHRFVLALLGHDPACAEWAHEDWRSNARSLLSVAHRAHHGEAITPDEAAASVALADGFCSAWGDGPVSAEDREQELFRRFRADLQRDPEVARELIDRSYVAERWETALAFAAELYHLGGTGQGAPTPSSLRIFARWGKERSCARRVRATSGSLDLRSYFQSLFIAIPTTM
jgi:hypothetical protein